MAVTQVLPERFLLDNGHIEWVMHSPVGSSDASASYRNIGTFYEVLGLGHRPELAALLTLLLFTATVFTAARWSELAHFGLVGLAVVGISFLCAAVYLAQYSKECIPLMLVLLLLALPRHPLSEGVFLILAVVYAVLFRPYWAIIAAFYVVWRFVLRRRRRALTIAGTVILLYLVLQVLFLNILGTSLTGNRELVNDARTGQDVGSLIVDPLPENVYLMVPNAVLLLLSLLFPVPLILKLSLFHVLSAVLIGFLWATVLVGIGRRSVSGVRPSLASPTQSASHRLRAARSAALLIAVVSVQAIFEPDFGSYLKHLTPLMPLFLTLVPFQPPGPDPRASRAGRLPTLGDHLSAAHLPRRNGMP